MGRNNYFQFKQFRIIQEQSAMKVGTDGVLIGAWANITDTAKILDIGTGTGLIALMLAQRSKASITAIEIEKISIDEAHFNLSQSQWEDRISVIHQSLQEFSEISTQKFDLIISNPPFFENDKRAAEINRSNARHSDLLSYNDLIVGVNKLLNKNGRFVVIFPNTEGEIFIQKAKQNNLFLNKLTKVFPTPQKQVNRYLMEFSFIKKEIITASITIREGINSEYSEAYKKLTKNFYLAF